MCETAKQGQEKEKANDGKQFCDQVGQTGLAVANELLRACCRAKNAKRMLRWSKAPPPKSAANQQTAGEKQTGLLQRERREERGREEREREREEKRYGFGKKRNEEREKEAVTEFRAGQFVAAKTKQKESQD